MQKVSLVLRHYNKLKPINCSVISGDINKLFTVKVMENEGAGTGMLKGDPILIGMLKEDDTFTVNGGSIVGANPKEEQYIICSNEVVNMVKELDKRQYQRYPTSLLGDIKLSGSNVREPACIKDFSYSGMCIYSTGDFNEDDVIEISVYLSNNVSKYDGTIIRKAKNFGRNEYGIQIIHRDKNSMYATENQLTNLVENEKELIYRHLVNSRYKF